MLRFLPFFSYVALSVFLVSCAPGQSAHVSSGGSVYQSVKMRNTSDLLDAQTGGFAVTEEKSAKKPSIDPLDAHMLARKQVQPADRSKKRQYTKAASVPGGNTRVRTLLLEGYAIGEHGARSKTVQRMMASKTFTTTTTPQGSVSPSLLSYVPKPTLKPAHVQAFVDQKVIEETIKPALKPVRKVSRVRTVQSDQSKKTAGVLNVRKGEHAEYTRIVFDMDANYAYTHVVKDQGRSLTIRLPDAQWSAPKEKTYAEASQLKSYTAHNTRRGGTLVTLRFKEEISLRRAEVFLSDNGKPHRLVLDVHKKR